MGEYKKGYLDGINKAIEIIERYKDSNQVLILIIRAIKEAKKKELKNG